MMINEAFHRQRPPARGKRREGQNRMPISPITRLPPLVGANWEWRQDAACRGADHDLFFHPDDERGPRRRHREAAAKAVCASCPVIMECRTWALDVAEPFGIWGGLSAEQRDELRRHRTA